MSTTIEPGTPVAVLPGIPAVLALLAGAFLASCAGLDPGDLPVEAGRDGGGRTSPGPLELAAIEPAGGPAAMQARAWPAAGDCVDLIEALDRARALGHLPLDRAGAPLVIRPVDQREPLITLVRDLALPLDGDEDSAGASCTLGVEPVAGSLQSITRETGRRRLSSQYRISDETKPNPAWHEANKEVETLEREGRTAKSSSFRSSGDPMFDLIALGISGVGRLVDAWYEDTRLAAAREALSAIPPTISEPVWKTYWLDARTLELTRGLDLRLTLRDRRTGEVRTASRHLASAESFDMAQGLHPDDRQIIEKGHGLASEADVRAAQGEPLELSYSSLLEIAAAALRDGGDTLPPPDPARAKRLTAAPDDPPEAVIETSSLSSQAPRPVAGARSSDGTVRPIASPNPPGDPGSSLVLVGEERPGFEGVYVAPDRILTVTRALGRSSLVPVTTHDGFQTYAVLIARDDRSGLALLHLPRPGAPIAVADDAARPAYPRGRRSGTALFDAGRLSGFLIDAASEEVAGPEEISRFLAARS